MKKSKIERIIFPYKLGITEVDWPAVKAEVDDKIQKWEKDGYKNPRLCHDEYEIWIEVTKVESDESYAARIAEAEKKEEFSRERRIEKLKKEAKELGLKVE